MFAARDQENLIHARQTTAAGKPSNQGIRALHPKTPGNVKTPFRASKNNENQNLAQHGQKTLVKGEGSKFNHNSFVTPAARPRAPLGAKTTNAKAQPLKTPGFGQTIKQDKPTKQLSTTRRSARKIIVAPTEVVPQTVLEHDADDEPDFGYAPPPIQELPDPPFDFGYDDEYSQLTSANMFKGYGEIYFGSPNDEDGLSIRLKREEEDFKLARENDLAKLRESIARQESIRSDPDAKVKAMIAAGPRSQRQTKGSEVSTIKAKSAVSALSAGAPTVRDSKSIHSSGASRGTVASISKSVRSSGKVPLSVSKNTIGFPKAKQPPSILPKTHRSPHLQNKQPDLQPRDEKSIHPTEFVKLYGEPPLESEMWFRLKQHELLEQESQDLFAGEDGLSAELSDLDLFAPSLDDDDGLFQLPVPDD